MKRKDLTGNKFGDLTVIKYSHNDHATRSHMWVCKCTCGNTKTIHGYALTHGYYKSCGCKRDKKRDEGLKKHIDKDTVDGTRKSALRAKLHKNNKSGHKGVTWLKSRNKWRAYIGYQSKQIALGYFDNKEDAITARKKAEEKYHKPILEGDKNDN